MLSDLKTDFITMMTPIAKAQAKAMSNNGEEQAQTSVLTMALNAFDEYACHLSVANALKFKRSLALPNCAEMFLQFNDAERQEQIQDVLENSV